MSLKWFQYFVKTLKVALQFQIPFIGELASLFIPVNIDQVVTRGS
jgi:hypothetical protein